MVYLNVTPESTENVLFSVESLPLTGFSNSVFCSNEDC